ncbi:MAG: cupin domain-containing protein [Rhodospirillaceae bacterium]|nr:cupin domain-containing protein [Rhodospirillaceae bacterium]
MSATIPPAVRLHRFADDGRIPNNPRLPLLVYPGVLPRQGDVAAACERLFQANGWGGGWRDGIFPYHHFHSTAHEVLGIVRGSARVLFGGQSGVAVDVEAGDVVVIPAGVGHKRLAASPDLLVVGAYPHGQPVDLCKGEAGAADRVRAAIARVPVPPADPVHGPDGPLVRHWRGDPPGTP